MANYNWQYLVDKYLANSISKEELAELLRMADEQENLGELTNVLKRHWESAQEKGSKTGIDWDRKFAVMMNEPRRESPVVPLEKREKRKLFYRITAAVIVSIVCTATYFLVVRKPETNKVISASPIIKKDIPAPGSSNAILTLANGQTIALDSASNGALAMQGNTSVEKLADGQIVYKGKPTAEIQYNILSVPKGSRIANITLADGTRVWLNAGSSLKYPVAFSGAERKVDITGEAYFEVAHDKAMPFKVQKGATQVTVLGTHFNINSYDDEPVIKVTLLQGAVKINKGSGVAILKPGEQARISAGIKTSGDVDTDEVLAWINGKFQFGEAADIASVMKQISRWYDVEVEYTGTVTSHIGGTISRTENVSQVLRMLEMTGGVTFKIIGKKIVVMPK